MILGIKERSTKGFSLDRKNSYSISLTSLLLSHEINISVTNIREFGMSHSVVKGENSSFMMFFFFFRLAWTDINECNITKSGQIDLGGLFTAGSSF